MVKSHSLFNVEFNFKVAFMYAVLNLEYLKKQKIYTDLIRYS